MGKSNPKVLVSNGEFKHTLAVVRHLAAAGYDISVIARTSHAMAAASKFCLETLLSQGQTSAERWDELRGWLMSGGYDVFMPIGADTLGLCVEHDEEIQQWTHTILPDRENYRLAEDKWESLKLAMDLGILVPRTVLLDTPVEDQMFPAVLKVRREANVNVCRVNSQQNLNQAIEKLSKESGLKSHGNSILQQYVEGTGFGFFALYDRGRCILAFCHRRIREYPAGGGPSCCAETYWDDALADQGRRLLDALHWHGVAMVEFRGKQGGPYYFMEINPKFWGSLELAILSGANFPLAYCRLATRAQLPPLEQRNIRICWPLTGDLHHALRRPRAAPGIFLDWIRPGSRTDIWISDWRPHWRRLQELYHYYLRKS